MDEDTATRHQGILDKIDALARQAQQAANALVKQRQKAQQGYERSRQDYEKAQQDHAECANRCRKEASEIAKHYMTALETMRKQFGWTDAEIAEDKRPLLERLREHYNKAQPDAQTVYGAAISALNKKPDGPTLRIPKGLFSPKKNKGTRHE
jgi:dsDNA-specific endonuclease/ATPase MutS2